MSGRLVSTIALALLLYPATGFAQSPQPVTEDVSPAYVAHVEGAVSLERDGRPENAPLNMPLLSGDRLKTFAGRVEVLYGDGSALHLDERTTLDIQADDLARLIDGRLRLNISGSAHGVAYRIDSPAGSVRITQPGEYRVSLLHGQGETQIELAVLRGGAEIFTDQGSTPVRAGERAYASAGLAPSYPYAYNSANWDAFDRWSEARRDTRLGVSAQYLPEDVRTYASTFDEYGDWRYQQAYGYVWYPRVAAGWRPYYYGRWAAYPRYGWTWIGADAFAWPTHHYGRWGFSAGVWFWIPAARWAPAYVSWAYAPGYVSWCPLGFDNRPVIAINIFNTGPGYYSPYRAWTSVAYSQFGRDYYVHQRAVNWDRFDRDRRPRFQVAAAAPSYRDVAVPRNAAPIRWAGRTGTSSPAITGGERASSAPRYTNRGNAIVRSQAERPSAPRGDSYAVPRTAPEGPARRVDAAQGARQPSSRDYRASVSSVERVAPRGSEARPEVAQPRGMDPRVVSPAYQRPGSARRADAPAYQPRAGDRRVDAPDYQPRTAVPRADSPVYQPRTAVPRADSPAADPRSYGAPGRAPEYVRPRGGGYEAPRAAPAPAPQPNPGAAERRGPPPAHAAPAGERAVPREGARPAPAAGAAASRSRGRGGL